MDMPSLLSDSVLTFRPSTAGKVVASRESIGSIATLHDSFDAGGGNQRINGLVRSRSRDVDPGAISGVALTRNSDRALVIGLGNGRSAAAVHTHGFNEVVVAEASKALALLLHSTAEGAATLAEGGFVLQNADGRAYLRSELEQWDFVLVDQPELSGVEAGGYCTSEFYALVAARLAQGGVLRQELALERLSPVALAAILASARKSFAEVQLTAEDTAATLVACAGGCRLAPAAAAREAADSASKRIWVDSEDVDELVASVAETIHVPADSLASGDDDMFLRFQAPVSFGAAPGEVPDSRRLLDSFAYRR
jgi:spermidine synthase